MRPSLADVFIFGGLALAGYGIWLISQPAAFIAVGTVLLGIGLVGAWRQTK